AAHVFDKHQFLMPRAVVMHDREHRQLMMHRSPQHTRRIVQIAIGLNIDDNPISAFCGQCCTNRCWSAISHSAYALTTEITPGLVVIPQLCMMTAGEAAG